ncbi:MAG: hypothetical protein P8I94_03690 [Emcibacteraceae bacterium]|nr:hypothetical protein [Emcibacteraceae bacterium]
MPNIFDLEQRIMKCWNVVDDLNDVYAYTGDHEFFAGMNAKHSDEISNLLLGMAKTYDLKFQMLFENFEEVAAEFHSRGRQIKDLEDCVRMQELEIEECKDEIVSLQRVGQELFEETSALRVEKARLEQLIGRK